MPVWDEGAEAFNLRLVNLEWTMNKLKSATSWLGSIKWIHFMSHPTVFPTNRALHSPVIHAETGLKPDESDQDSLGGNLHVLWGRNKRH